jgi:ABC-type sulfate/molybdate transport systems ATPase subunit
MSLLVEIEKKLPGFKLQLQFSCGQEIIGVLGASGSGKSMLLNCIAGLVRPDKGKIVFRDEPFYDSARNLNLKPQKRKTGYLFQNYAMFPRMTVAENIAFGLERLDKTEQKRKVDELLTRFHLENLGSRYPSQLSGGQQQRVALARAMAVEPQILLLDEPFSALDTYLKNQMMKEMQDSLKEFQGTTLFVTHNMEEAYRLCDRLIVLNQGRVETMGTKKEVFCRPATMETAKISGCKNIAAAVRRAEHTAEIPDWGIRVATNMSIESKEGFVGIRANHLELAQDGNQENCYPVWIAEESEAPFGSTLYLKIGSAPRHGEDFHLQWEARKKQRDEVVALPQPFFIRMDPQDVFFMSK